MELLTEAERGRIVEAIKAAESGHRGEIRVHVEGRCPSRKGGALGRAERLFHKLGMAKTQEGTGVLLYIAVRSRQAAVFGGPAVADGPWPEVVGLVSEAYGRQAGVDGIVAAVGRIGEVLLEAVPGDDPAGDELPDAVSES